MRGFFVASLLCAGMLASCAPSQQVSTERMVTVRPVLVKLSEGAPRGGTLTIQGRYLGGPANGQVRLGGNDRGEGGVVLPAASVKSWTDTEIVVTIPANAPLGGSWVFVEVGGKQSTGLPFSVTQ